MFDFTFETKNSNNFNPSDSQLLIVEEVKTGANIVVRAFAGAAKTTTAILITENYYKPTLYLAFNKANADEAKTRFPSHVECRTGHSLAYENIVKGSSFAKKGRIAGYYDYKEIKEILIPFLKFLSEERKFAFMSQIVDIIKGYCNSANKDLSSYIQENLHLEDEEIKKEIYIQAALLLWGELSNPKSKYKTTHDIYFKLWHLSKPDLSKYELIIIDEFQDTNPVMLDIFLSQEKSQKVAIGDEFQSIYGWRGAVNAFDNINWNILYLNESYRFTQDIANIANKIISPLGAQRPLIGKGVSGIPETEAVICRNNATIFQYMIYYAEENKTFETSIDTQDLFSALYTASALFYTKKGETPNFGQWPHKQIASYSSWKELCEESSPEINKIVKLVEFCVQKGGVHKTVQEIKRFLIISKMKENDPSIKGDIFLSTGHKSKGLEWDKVTLADDFLPYYPEDCDPDEIFKEFIEQQGANLLYVAITRAKKELCVSSEMQSFINNFEYMVKSM